MKEQFTLFKNIRQTTQGDTVCLSDVYTIITSPQLKPFTDYVREAANDTERNQRKGSLPYITANGTFSQRNEQGLTDYSGITCIDFDHIPLDGMVKMKESLRRWPLTLFLFTSPSGAGLKLFVRHDNQDPRLHENLYLQLVRLCDCPYIDRCVKDISRATYLCYDPDCYWNPEAQTYHFTFDASLQVAQQHKVSNGSVGVKRDSPMTTDMITRNESYQTVWSDKALINYIDKHEWDGFRDDYKEGHRNDTILRKAGQLFRCGVSYDAALQKLTRLYCEVFSDMQPSEVESRVHYIYSTVCADLFGTQRQKWIDKRNTAVNSFLTRNQGFQRVS